MWGVEYVNTFEIATGQYVAIYTKFLLEKKVMTSQKVPFCRVERFRHLLQSCSHTFPPKFDHFPIVRFR